MVPENYNQQGNPQFNQPPYNQGYNQQPPYNQQPYNQGYPQQQLPPDNGMVWAILTTLFCCLPFGIVAIVKASNVNSLWMSGNYDAARQAAKSSKNWSIAAVCTGLGISIIYFILIILGALASNF